jgi:hypothetical protein
MFGLCVLIARVVCVDIRAHNKLKSLIFMRKDLFLETYKIVP